MNHSQKIWDAIWYVLSLPLLPIGKTTLTVWMVLYAASLLWGLIAITGTLQKKIVNPALSKTNFDPDLQNILALTLRYSTVTIGSIIILNTAGIEMTALTVIAGAVGLGLSLGLQTIAKNFIGGLVILFERPIKLGDRIQVGDTTGIVARIALRATTLRTDDRLDVIVPNADFISGRIINWTHTDTSIRVSIPFSFPINNNDPEKISKIIIKSATACSSILKDPAPEIFLDSFGEKTMNFILQVSTKNLADPCRNLRSEINFLVYERLKTAGIELTW